MCEGSGQETGKEVFLNQKRRELGCEQECLPSSLCAVTFADTGWAFLAARLCWGLHPAKLSPLYREVSNGPQSSWVRKHQRPELIVASRQWQRWLQTASHHTQRLPGHLDNLYLQLSVVNHVKTGRNWKKLSYRWHLQVRKMAHHNMERTRQGDYLE